MKERDRGSCVFVRVCVFRPFESAIRVCEGCGGDEENEWFVFSCKGKRRKKTETQRKVGCAAVVQLGLVGVMFWFSELEGRRVGFDSKKWLRGGCRGDAPDLQRVSFLLSEKTPISKQIACLRSRRSPQKGRERRAVIF